MKAFWTILVSVAAACGGGDDGGGGPAWLKDARILVQGGGVPNTDCRAGICPHNENTDLIVWNDAIWLVHRTAMSQVLGPNSALHIYRSDDGGGTFVETAVVLAPVDRDIRDPHFYVVGGDLYLKSLTRLPVVTPRDQDVDTIAVESHSSDGVVWSDLVQIGPPTWSFWRIREHDGVYYNAAYEDGDLSVRLFTSTDGVTWSEGAWIYTVSEDTPLETELTFLPSGRLLALVRMDGTDEELLGNGRLRTQACWSDPPYDSFDCPQEITGERLDGPLTFFWQDRLFVIARKHLPEGNRKRTALYEVTGDLDTGPIGILEWGELPSAGDTAYAGAAPSGDEVVVSWYSSFPEDDAAWAQAMLGPSDIWMATLDLAALEQEEPTGPALW
jgi:hypothetical protein